MGKIVFKNTEIHYRDEGKGNALVLLHGFMENKGMWENFFQFSGEHMRIVAIDLPGHGESGTIEEVHSMTLMAEAVRAVLDELEILDCVIAGHSMGGYVSLEYARLFPPTLFGLCLFHSHASADDEEAKLNRDRTIELVEQDKGDFIASFVRDLFAEDSKEIIGQHIDFMVNEAMKTSKEGIIAALKGMKDRNSNLQLLNKSHVPVLFIGGKQDKRIPVDKIMSQAMMPPHAEVLMLEQAGHMGFIEAPLATIPTLVNFATKCYFAKG